MSDRILVCRKGHPMEADGLCATCGERAWRTVREGTPVRPGISTSARLLAGGVALWAVSAVVALYGFALKDRTRFVDPHAPWLDQGLVFPTVEVIASSIVSLAGTVLVVVGAIGMGVANGRRER